MFAKVFQQILDSSIASDYRVRFVFEDFLKLAKKSGNDWVVDMTPEVISRRTGVPIDIVSYGIAELERPDPRSRTPDEQGRRIVRLDGHRDWGWRIVNYEKYRHSATMEMLRMGDAERKRAYRQRFSPHTPLLGETESEVEAESEQSENGIDKSQTRPRQRFVKPSLDEVKQQALIISLPEREVDKFYNFYESKGWKVGKTPMVSWKHALGGWRSRWLDASPQGAVTVKRDPDLWPGDNRFSLTKAPPANSSAGILETYSNWKTRRLAQKGNQK